MIDPKYDKRLRTDLLLTFALCGASILPPVLALIWHVRPSTDTLGAWFQRSGALTTALAVFAQVKAGNFAERIRGGTFAESWTYYHKYKNYQTAAFWISAISVISGTVIWGYGDLLLARLWGGRM